MLRVCLGVFVAVTMLFWAGASAALADDWVVIKLRGKVLQLVDDEWEPLQRGDVVSDERVLRTLRNGRAELQRGKEVVSLGPDTQVQIHDKDGKQFTTVQEYFGTVEVDAEARNVQHFAVQTPFLAAVVKGTHFTVTTSETGSEVEVQRGHVEVRDALTGQKTVLAVGQNASIGSDGSFDVEGSGTLPVIVDKTGKVAGTSNGKAVGLTGSASGGSVNAGVGLKVGQDGTPPGLAVRTDVGAGENGANVSVSADTGKVSVDVGVNIGKNQSSNGEGSGLGLKIGLGLGR